MKRAAAVAAILVAAAGTASPARAYVIQKTSTGKEIHFTSMPQPFYLNQLGSADVADDSEIDSLRAAFATWNDVPECDAKFDKLALTTRGETDVFNDHGQPGRDKMNEVVWVEDTWIEGSEKIALTYTYYNDVTGKIYEDDLTLNGVDYSWATDGDASHMDVQEIATHEIGHAFGLDHSLDPTATMYASAFAGETSKRDLAQDDIDAIQHLYPPGCCKHTVAGDLLTKIGCEIGGLEAPGAAAAAALGLALAAFAIVRKRRRALLLAPLLLLARPAHASVEVSLSLDDLRDAATLVVHGTVLDVTPVALDNGAVITVTQVAVADAYKGTPGDVITVIEPGGVDPVSHDGLLVEGAARFEPGEEVVVFATPSKGGYATAFPGTLRPVGMAQGAFEVEPGGRLVRDLSGTARLVSTPGGWRQADGDPLEGLTLDALRDRLR